VKKSTVAAPRRKGRVRALVEAGGGGGKIIGGDILVEDGEVCPTCGRPMPGFDKREYQKEYMRKRRAEKRGGV